MPTKKTPEKKSQPRRPAKPDEKVKIVINGRRRTLPTTPLTGEEVSRMWRVRIHVDYYDAWDELSALQRGQLVTEAIEARRARQSEIDMSQEP